MTSPHQVTRDFEAALAEYAGAPYAVTTTSCTMAIFLALQLERTMTGLPAVIECPKHTYVSVPMQIIHCGGRVRWVDADWYADGQYRLKPTRVVDSARLLTSGMHRTGELTCLSFHWGKTLGLSQGGAILCDDADEYEWLKRARFDGRTEGIAPRDDDFMLGWHAYLSPEVAAHGIMKLALLPEHNAPLPPDGYPDLSTAKVFEGHHD